MKFSTKAIHLGYNPDTTGAVIPPIYMTSTFAQDAPGQDRGYDYTRADNPNFTYLEKTLAPLEEAEYATVFSSGLGALTAMIGMLSAGSRVLAVGSLYGGTWRLFHAIFKRFNVQLEILNKITFESLDQSLATKPAWLLFETPTNPLLEVVDIEACCKIARRHSVTTIVDNTFASPYCQNPLKWGADMVWHSTTKYIGGHSDVVGGAVMTNSDTIKRDLDFMRKSLGLNPSPFDAWLITRGVKTLALRMERQQHNALLMARYLEKLPKVLKVYYPGLKEHPQHAIAAKQMTGFGGMVSVEFSISKQSVYKLISSLALFTLAESLGGIESLISHPASMTHAAIPAEERTKMGLTDGLVRISMGIEDIQDLINDFEQAIELIS